MMYPTITMYLVRVVAVYTINDPTQDNPTHMEGGGMAFTIFTWNKNQEIWEAATVRVAQ